jgi:urease accessory protein
LNDSFYPTGSYAHSFGLEGLTQENVVHDRVTLRAFVFDSVVPALRQTDLPLAGHAWRALAEPDWKRVGDICVLSSALKTAREARFAAENIGRQRVELAASLHHHPLAVEFIRRARQDSWPFSPSVAAAIEGQVHGTPIEGVLASIYYASVSSLLAAAMKLLRLGQIGCQTLLTEALNQAPTVIARALTIELDDIGWFNPWLDIATARHETATARLFIS